ncbi:hypothetical protein ACFL60_04510 [Candidatus Omnitrophota bacterium]
MKCSNSYTINCMVSNLFIVAVLMIIHGTDSFCQTPVFTVNRTDAAYEEVLTDRTIERQVTSFYNSFYGKPMQYSDEVWEAEQHHFLLESADAGIDGPFALDFIKRIGEPIMNEYYEKYGMKFPIMAPMREYSNAAKKAGAAFLFSTAYNSWERGLVACWDPHFIEAAKNGTEKWLTLYAEKPWLSCIMGQDEPFNWAGTARAPGAVDRVNKAIKQQYGIKIALSPQDTTIASTWEMTDPAILNKPYHEVALFRVAVWRWLNEQLYSAAKPQFDLIRRFAPGIAYHAYNRNAINIMDFINKDVPNSIDRIDQSAFYDVTDCYSADPYPTMNFARIGRERSLYHVGFVAKFITDLAAGKPTKMILQGFQQEKLPTAGGITEMVSQSAKAGVTHLEWWGNSRYTNPDYYRETLRLSRLWNDMPALDIPKTSDIAVIFSDDSRNAENDDLLHAHYMLHVILGEHLGTWYTFIGENYVKRGLQSLSGKKLIFAPQLSYVSLEFAEHLLEQVKNGATLVVLDPDIFSHDIESGSLKSLRKNLMGAPLGKKRDASHLLPTREGRNRFGNIDHLILQPGKTGVTARTLNIPSGAAILFDYEDGTPAVYSLGRGKGEVIMFSAKPFGTSKFALRNTGWETLIEALCKERDIVCNLPVWRFQFPETGGEVTAYELLEDTKQKHSQQQFLERSRNQRTQKITWKKAASFSFDIPAAITECPVPEGTWKVSGGKLRAVAGDKNRAILLMKNVGNQVRIEFEVTNTADEEGRLGDITVLLNAVPGKTFFSNGYALTTASYWNNCTTFYKKGKPIARTEFTPVESGKMHRVALEFNSGHIRYWLDNRIVLEVWDDKPLTMDSGCWIGIRTWATSMVVDNVVVMTAE